MTSVITEAVLRAAWIVKAALTVAGLTLFTVAFSGGVYPLSTTGTIMASVAAFAGVVVVDSVVAKPLWRHRLLAEGSA